MSDPTSTKPGFFANLFKDDGVQRAAAGVVVAVIVATAKAMIFRRA